MMKNNNPQPLGPNKKKEAEKEEEVDCSGINFLTIVPIFMVSSFIRIVHIFLTCNVNRSRGACNRQMQSLERKSPNVKKGSILKYHTSMSIEMKRTNPWFWLWNTIYGVFVIFSCICNVKWLIVFTLFSAEKLVAKLIKKTSITYVRWLKQENPRITILFIHGIILQW